MRSIDDKVDLSRVLTLALVVVPSLCLSDFVSASDWRLEDYETASTSLENMPSKSLVVMGETNLLYVRELKECHFTKAREAAPAEINGVLVSMKEICTTSKEADQREQSNLDNARPKYERYQQLSRKQQASAILSLSQISGVNSAAPALTKAELREMASIVNELNTLAEINYKDTVKTWPSTLKGHKYLLNELKQKNEVCIDGECFSAKGFSKAIKVTSGQVDPL
ncbi:hypothetical protein [Agarivorans litoreus]|uniref:hypothetical protein n=1 Tax=Agarivorans litoreus TaxID=1510455 RepID=UPI001C7D330D|nr:hypothetical protein [Agarivorans litoreus]